MGVSQVTGKENNPISVEDAKKRILKSIKPINKTERINSEDNNLLTEPELLTNDEDKSLLDEPSILEDNGDNPLGIVIEPSLPEVSEEKLPDITIGPLDNDQSEVSMNEMEIGMDMN